MAPVLDAPPLCEEVDCREWAVQDPVVDWVVEPNGGGVHHVQEADKN